ncbi:MarR family winged helix-turn-helix transcriptional regulator [Desulfohalobium retbaense]|uniref:Transcriptional regulator, MarR family n=1 Tax=Desulfohalobium retbaense (strain ATCC 49708 / DSM 5692 / JCM 16813 / HR100) TaxID=485915 RepID=C8WZD2_DESRD|nr:MarR family transcriptional regulator [Desulfohalobium retbaense]ACV67407.1 transcriptional regulator, MarR family [Desulfohalobium retbaense DSM 5692]
MYEDKEFLLEDSPGFLLNRTALRIKKDFQRRISAAELDVTAEQCAVLWSLWRREGCFQRELAEQTFKDITNITRILDGLERRGMVRRVRDEHDRRMSRVYLTEQGTSLQDKITAIASELGRDAYQGIDESDLQELRRVLNLVYANLSDA